MLATIDWQDAITKVVRWVCTQASLELLGQRIAERHRGEIVLTCAGRFGCLAPLAAGKLRRTASGASGRYTNASMQFRTA